MSSTAPLSTVASLSDDELRALMAAAVKLMKANITERSGDPIVTYFGMRQTTGRSDPTDSLWVYHRTGKPCRKCGTAIMGRKHGIDARSSFWCPQCQGI